MINTKENHHQQEPTTHFRSSSTSASYQNDATRNEIDATKQNLHSRSISLVVNPKFAGLQQGQTSRPDGYKRCQPLPRQRRSLLRIDQMKEDRRLRLDSLGQERDDSDEDPDFGSERNSGLSPGRDLQLEDAAFEDELDQQWTSKTDSRNLNEQRLDFHHLSSSSQNLLHFRLTGVFLRKLSQDFIK